MNKHQQVTALRAAVGQTSVALSSSYLESLINVLHDNNLELVEVDRLREPTVDEAEQILLRAIERRNAEAQAEDEHVVLVAFTVLASSFEQANYQMVDWLPKPDQRIVESWWVAEDTRFDGSDCESAVFVPGDLADGGSGPARAALNQHDARIILEAATRAVVTDSLSPEQVCSLLRAAVFFAQDTE